MTNSEPIVSVVSSSSRPQCLVETPGHYGQSPGHSDGGMLIDDPNLIEAILDLCIMYLCIKILITISPRTE